MSTRAATNWRALEENILKTMKMSVRPVAVAFLGAEPAGVKKFEDTQPSGCSFWRLAAQGHTFYTVPKTTLTARWGRTLTILHFPMSAVIGGANAALPDYARGRREQLSAQ
jgi:hypothetical protein